jgi:predicted dinucleotide-binding enzyme
VSTAIVGVGNIGAVVAGQLVAGGEPVVLTSRDDARAESLAKTLGPLARAASVDEALSSADAVVFAVWLDTMRELVAANASLLENKTIIDPSNPIGFDASGQMMRTLPEGQSAASVIASLLPPNAHYVKAFGTLAATDLAQQANREPRRAVLLYATDDGVAEAVIDRLIRSAGFDPLKVGGVDDAGRIEAPGGDLQGALFDLDQAHTTINRKDTF